MQGLGDQLFQIIICLFLIVLIIIFPGVAHDGVDMGLALFMESLFPYLLPILILSNWLSMLLAENRNKFLLYGRSYFLSAIGGYPTGAIIISQLLKTNQVSQKEASILLPILHHPNPLFILGFVSLELLHDTSFGIRYLIVLHSISFLFLIITFFIFPKGDTQHSSVKIISPFTTAIKETIHPITIVATTIIFFSTINVIITHFIRHYFETMPSFLQLILSSSLEITNGIFTAYQSLPSDAIILFLVFYLTTQSLSIHIQVYVIAKEQMIPMAPYILLRITFSVLVPIGYFLFFK